jgi:hypothetical protein
VPPSREASSPLWARALALNALSDPRFVPIAVAGLFALLALRSAIAPFGDQDAGWLAATGRQLLETHAVPRTNGWSITDAAMPWVVHEWALTPIYAVLTEHLGLAGPVCLGIGAAFGSTVLLVAATIGRTARLAAGAITCLVAIALTRECLFEPRPAYVMLGAPIAMMMLALAPRFTPRHAIACVALELVWANAHGSFPLGVGVLVLGAVAHASDRRARVTAIALASIATLATPYGTDLFVLVGRYAVGGDTAAEAIHAHIAEFQPLWSAGPVFGGAPRVIGVALVALLGALGVAKGDRVARTSAFGALCMAALAVAHARHVPQAITLGAALLAPTIDRLIADVPLTTHPFDRTRLARTVAPWLLGAATIAIALACVRGVHADDALGGDALPSLAHDPRVAHARAFVAFDASGRFLWLAPDARVLFDPRNDCYAGETARVAYTIEEGDCIDGCLAAALDDFEVDVAIVPDDHASLRTLRGLDSFEEVRSRGGWHLFTLRSGARPTAPAPSD